MASGIRLQASEWQRVSGRGYGMNDSPRGWRPHLRKGPTPRTRLYGRPQRVTQGWPLFSPCLFSCGLRVPCTQGEKRTRSCSCLWETTEGILGSNTRGTNRECERQLCTWPHSIKGLRPPPRYRVSADMLPRFCRSVTTFLQEAHPLFLGGLIAATSSHPPSRE